MILCKYVSLISCSDRINHTQVLFVYISYSCLNNLKLKRNSKSKGALFVYFVFMNFSGPIWGSDCKADGIWWPYWACPDSPPINNRQSCDITTYTDELTIHLTHCHVKGQFDFHCNKQR